MKNDSVRYHLVKNVLSILNEKFTMHGVRVAYIMLKLCEYENRKKDLVLRNLIEICIFHDIGAYNTEEVKDMLRFETVTTLQHSTYGYLFLRYLSNLGDYSEIILHHHTKYQDKGKIKSKFLDEAVLIHMIDRVDISHLNFREENEVISNIKRLSGTWFDPSDVELFLKANEKYNIIKHLEDEDYEQEIIDFYAGFPYDFDGIIDVLKILVHSIDFRSAQTVIHTLSSAITSKSLGIYFNLTEEEQENLYFGALLHDIGKICVPVEILESPERLSPEEMEIMRGHVTETGKIIENFVSPAIVQIAIRHHERSNGQGYPLGLKGDNLTISEKIVAVADVFCALIERRSYKERMHKEEVLNILHNMAAGGEFDSEVVDAISILYDQIRSTIAAASKDLRSRYESLKKDYQKVIQECSTKNNVFIRGNELFPDFSKAEQYHNKV